MTVIRYTSTGVPSVRVSDACRNQSALIVAPAAETRRRALTPKVWYVSPLPHELDYLFGEGRKEILAKLDKVTPFLFYDTVPLETDFPLDRFVSLATSFVVPDGQVAWIPVQVTKNLLFVSINLLLL